MIDWLWWILAKVIGFVADYLGWIFVSGIIITVCVATWNKGKEKHKPREEYKRIYSQIDTINEPNESKPNWDYLINKSKQGDTDAMLELGLALCKDGEETDPDILELSHKYFLMAANGGNIHAFFMAASNYISGTGVKQDKALGMKMLRDLADDMNYSNAQYLLGALILNGTLPNSNREEEAKKYLEAAAKQGHSDAKFFLNKLQNTNYFN